MNIFDWKTAALVLRELKPYSAHVGISSFESGIIFREGSPYFGGVPTLAHESGIPMLVFKGGEDSGEYRLPCFIDIKEDPLWEDGAMWPEYALEIFYDGIPPFLRGSRVIRHKGEKYIELYAADGTENFFSTLEETVYSLFTPVMDSVCKYTERFQTDILRDYAALEAIARFRDNGKKSYEESVVYHLGTRKNGINANSMLDITPDSEIVEKFLYTFEFSPSGLHRYFSDDMYIIRVYKRLSDVDADIKKGNTVPQIKSKVKAYQIMEEFDELLTYKGIEIPCTSATEEDERHDYNNDAAIYGTEYGELVDRIMSILSEVNL